MYLYILHFLLADWFLNLHKLWDHFIFLQNQHVDSNWVQSFSHVWLCDPTDCSTPGLPVFHRLPELTQTHVHWISDAIRPTCPLLPSPPAFSLSQHQGLFQEVGSSHQVVKVLELQHQLPMNIQGWLPLGLTALLSLQFKGLSRVFSKPIIRKWQFFGTQTFYGPTLRSILEKPSLWLGGPLLAK